MKRLLLCLGVILPMALTAAACGQKGGLYLPPRNGTVVTRPADAAGTPPQTTNQSASPQDTVTLPSTTTSESTPSGTLRQDPGPASQATGSKQSGTKKSDESHSQSPEPPKRP